MLNRSSFSSLMSKGDKKMYGKKKPKVSKKKPKKKVVSKKRKY
tara:strand:- start:3895 stop:4023 length:129 start_codon:yes stop_codon:yes gene_type:complete